MVLVGGKTDASIVSVIARLNLNLEKERWAGMMGIVTVTAKPDSMGETENERESRLIPHPSVSFGRILYTQLLQLDNFCI